MRISTYYIDRIASAINDFLKSARNSLKCCLIEVRMTPRYNSVYWRVLRAPGISPVYGERLVVFREAFQRHAAVPIFMATPRFSEAPLGTPCQLNTPHSYR